MFLKSRRAVSVVKPTLTFKDIVDRFSNEGYGDFREQLLEAFALAAKAFYHLEHHANRILATQGVYRQQDGTFQVLDAPNAPALDTGFPEAMFRAAVQTSFDKPPTADGERYETFRYVVRNLSAKMHKEGLISGPSG